MSGGSNDKNKSKTKQSPSKSVEKCQGKSQTKLASSSSGSRVQGKVSSKESDSVKSTKSNTSVDSRASMGIGPSKPKPPSPDAYLRFRLMPEGLGTNLMNIYEHRVFDCVVFVIICDKHNTVALTDPAKRNYSWFPFIPLQDVSTWARVSRDGLAIILGHNKKDIAGEMDPTMATLPENSRVWMNMLRLQMPNTKRFHTRLTQVVTLQASNERQCCQPTDRIQWVNLSDIFQRVKMDQLWGDEVVTMCQALTSVDRVFLSEFTIDDVKNFYDGDTDEAQLIRQINWSEEQVLELGLDYASHLYPACQMTINSLRAFLVKNELLSKDDTPFEGLFKAFAAGKGTVSFSHLLVGLACMDPKAPNHSQARAKFAFNYYAQKNQSILSVKEIKQLAADLGGDSKTNKFIKSLGDKTTQEHFVGLLQDRSYSFPDKWLRLEQSYFVSKINKKKNKSASKSDSKSGSDQRGSAKSTSKCTGQNEGTSCTYHQLAKYDYAMHSATLDSSGRCVDPRIIADTWSWPDNEMTRQRFSMENVFQSGSIANNLISLIRDFKEKELKEKHHPKGLLTGHEELPALFESVEQLCNQLIRLLRHEPKLLRLAAPMYIFGDIQGSLVDLFKYDHSVFRSAPTTPHSLLFLGNYSGATFAFGFECIVYLFALKVSLPNKVYLLRGQSELRQFNESHLKVELANKYGAKHGHKMYEHINRVFDHLPLGAVIDETVLATHSGIPNMAPDSKLISAFAKYATSQFAEVHDLKQTIPMGYEMVVNIPARYAEDDQLEEARRKDFTADRKRKHFHYFNQKAFSKFMGQNGFDYHIRSHNPTLDAYALCFHNRCLTIFSCHKQSNTLLNSTSIMLIDGASNRSKIRFLRYDRNVQKVTSGGSVQEETKART